MGFPIETDEKFKMEFLNKSNSKRRKIFKKRVRAEVKSLARAFYERAGVKVRKEQIDELTRDIVEGVLIEIKEEPEFFTRALDPSIENEAEHVRKLSDSAYDALKDRKLFKFASE